MFKSHVFRHKIDHKVERLNGFLLNPPSRSFVHDVLENFKKSSYSLKEINYQKHHIDTLCDIYGN